MDYINLPKELLYKDRSDLKEFGTNIEDSLNNHIYKLLRIHFRSIKSLKPFTRLLLWIFNESYYLTTIILLDKHAIEKINEYRNSIFLDSLYTVKDTNKYQEVIFALTCVYLTKPSQKSTYLNNVRRFLSYEVSEFLFLEKELQNFTKPDKKEFAPVTLTKELLSIYDWKKLTYDYNLKEIKDIVNNLGNDGCEKLILIKTIFQSFYHSGNMSYISYDVDKYLMDKYLVYGGTKEDLTTWRSDANSELEKDNRIKELELEKASLLDIINNMEAKNKRLADSINVLNTLLRDHNEEIQRMSLSEAEHQKREDILQKQLEEMGGKVNKFKEKLGTKTVPLKSLAEGLKRYAKLYGLEKGKNLLMSLTYLLQREQAWIANVEALEDFFIEAEMENKKALLTLENKQGGIVQISEPTEE